MLLLLERHLTDIIHIIGQFCEHPAGPFTIHFWAPTFKWVISLANVADMRKSPDCISLSQQMGRSWSYLVEELNHIHMSPDFEPQIAVTATGVIWSRYSLIINPVNYNLFSVNVFMAGTYA